MALQSERDDMTAKEIIKMLGGRAFVANMTFKKIYGRNPEGAEIGKKLPMVGQWCLRNYIPDWWRDTLLEIAAKQGRPLTADDFPVKGDEE